MVMHFAINWRRQKKYKKRCYNRRDLTPQEYQDFVILN